MAKDFTFKQFHIQAKNCGMPVSTDAVLLGAWADINKAKHLLDLGCGTGLLALMCAQRNKDTRIIAIDINEHAINATKENILNSPWSDRVFAEKISAQEFAKNKTTFDTIICNPPYFNSGEQSQNSARATARHTDSLTHKELISIAQELLTENGQLHLILPVEEAKQLIESTSMQGGHLQLLKCVEVLTKVNKPASRLLLTFIKTQVSVEAQTNSLIIHEGAGYSQGFIKLTKAFYLNF